MAMTKESVKKLYTETYDEITSSGEQWKRFLNTASNVYRYNFTSQLMIYGQRPDASACASFNVWSEKMNRKIKYGSKGIALYDDIRGTYTYVFDVSDTQPMGNSRPINTWTMEFFHEKKVLDRLSSILGVPLDYNNGFAQNIIEVTRRYAEEQYRELEEDYRTEGQSLGTNEKQIEQERERQITFLTSSIAYSVLKRCGMSLDALDKRFDFSDVTHIDKEQLMALGDYSASMTDQILQEIKNAIREYDKEHFEEEFTDLQNYILNNKRELLSYEPKISFGDDGTSELNAVSVNIQDKSHEFALVLMNEGIFVTRVNSPQGLIYKNNKIFDDNVILSQNAEMFPLSEAPADIKYEILMHSSRYKECITALKIDLEERMSKDENAVQNGQSRSASTGNRYSGADRGSDQIRDDEIAISPGTQENHAEQIENGNVANRASVGYPEPGRGETGESHEADGRGRGSERSPESKESDALGTKNGEHSGIRRGDSSFRSDLHVEDNILRADTTQNPEYEQLNLFSNYEEQADKNVAVDTRMQYAMPAAFSLPQKDIDTILRSGSGRDNSRKHIYAKYQQGKTSEEMTDFLKKEYGTCGKGFEFEGKQVAVWFDETGMRIGYGASALEHTSYTMSWQEVEREIRAQVENGTYMSDSEAYLVDIEERDRIATHIYFFFRDGMGEFPQELELKSGNFPDSHSRLMELLSVPEEVKKIAYCMDQALHQLETGEKKLRFRSVMPKEELRAELDNLLAEKRSFPTSYSMDIKMEDFITQDEIDKRLVRGNGFVNGSFRIYDYFKEGHNSKDAAEFLKNVYGIGGSSPALVGADHSYEEHDANGIRLEKGNIGNPYAQVLLSWNVVEKRIRKLIEEDKYLSPAGREAYAQYKEEQAQKALEQAQAEQKITIEEGDDFPEIDTAYIREKLENGEADREADAMLAYARQVAKESGEEPIHRFSVAETSDAFDAGEDFAVWDDINGDYYKDEHGTVSTFETREQAEDYLKTVEKEVAEKEDSELPLTAEKENELSGENRETSYNHPEVVDVADIEYPWQEKQALEEQTQQATITCEWSEHPSFEDGKTYSVEEFDRLMKEADSEWVHKNEEALEKYGSRQAFYEAENEPLSAYLGYAKVKFTINMPDGTSITERQDIGDGDGGVIDFLRNYPQYSDVADVLNRAMSEHPEEIAIPDEKESNHSTLRNRGQEIAGSSHENYHFTDMDIAGGSNKEKFKANIEAIKTLKLIEEEDRLATNEEKNILAKYVGWGGLSDVFDDTKTDWSAEYVELKNLLSDSEYRNTRASTTDAFYTNPEIATCMYEALKNMGFTGGNLLEPSMGVGNFFGSMPESLEKQSKLYGVELDSLSGRIARALYPNADITIDGFEKTAFPNDFFDVAIGNVPFGETRVYDKDYKNQNFLIHDYFIAKSIDKVRSGGIVAVITSKGSMDKANESVRRYVNERAELIGAVRLPNSAFKKNAGTTVTSDILFFKKREAPNYSDAEWLHTVTKPDGMVINSYFDNHPEMVLGTMTMTSGKFGMVSTCEPDLNTPFVEQLRGALSNINARIDPPELMAEFDNDREVDSDIITIPADPDVRNFSYTLKDDTLYFRENSIMRTLNDKEARGKGAERIRGLLEIRNITTQLLNMQLDENVTDDQLAVKREELNNKYDEFTKKYGIINSRANKTAFQNDSSYNLLCSLEKLDDDGNVEAKADIFTKRTISIRKAVTHTESSVDALAVSLEDLGKVDINKMAELTGKSEEEVINDLYGIIFKNPVNDNWETQEEYLSGDIREKLAIAEKAAQSDTVYQINVDALQKALPKDLSAEDIDARLGSTWIDPEYIKDFMTEVLMTSKKSFEYGTMAVSYSDCGATWSIKGKQNTWGNVKVREVFGVKDVIDAYQLLELSLNLKEVKIYKTIDDGGKEKRVIDHDKTILAQQKQTELKEAFKEWIWKDFDRREKLVRKYNDLFNSTVPRHFNGSHLKFEGSNQSISLLPHQKNAVARILYGGNTLLAHCVGAGKTYTMIASAMEKKRLGLCHKNMIVVPNHLTEQWGSDFLKLYPNAKILVATKKDFEPANRKKFCSRIATGDFDAVIIGHSQFEKIPLSVEKQQQMVEQQMDEITMAINDEKNSGGDRLSIKQLEKTRKSLEKNLAELNDTKKDDVVTFEQLGIDSLYVDESHMFKNLYVYTKMTNVAGVQTTESKKATDMYNKCMYLDEITGGKGITFATGTPIANTMAELYTNMRYLQSSLLKKTKLGYFDAWASTFGETVTALEIKPEGNGFRTKTRFAKFFNLPELVNMWKESADIQTKEMLPELMARLPKVVQHNIVLNPSEEQKKIVASLAERADAVRNRQVQPDEDNMLKITNDGRKLALDQRLINPMLPDDENSKINACVKQAVEIWKNTEKDSSAQVIFCDLSTPKGKSAGNAEDKFSVYDDIKMKLIEKGVPEEEIAFIHDANTESQKAELFSKINKGKVRFILGSTEKMGAGTNIQKKLVALHHIDVPWRPSDLEQQEGRIIRQGNENDEVHIFRYVKEDTFDGYSWQTIENKNRFITQIMTDKSPVRRADDVDETVLDNATLKGLCVSDKRIKEKMDLDIDVQKLELLRSSFIAQIHQFEKDIKVTLPSSISNTENRISGIEKDISDYSARKSILGTEGFEITVKGITYTDKKEGCEAFLAALKDSIKIGNAKTIGEYMGFKIVSEFEPMSQKIYANLEGACTYKVEMGNDAGGCILRMNNKLNLLVNDVDKLKQNLEMYKKSLEEAKIEVLKPFPKEEELITKKSRLIELNAALNNDRSDKITFYVAENIECECAGKCSEDIESLSEAKEIFDKLSDGTGKGVGFKYKDMKYALINEKCIDADSIFRIEEFKNVASIHKAVKSAIKLFPDKKVVADEKTLNVLNKETDKSR